MKKIDPLITKGDISGLCPKCGNSYRGSFHHNVRDIFLKCENENCSHEGHYIYYWPDELPKVILRHKSSRMLVGRPKKKAKRKNKSDVLPGQLKFSFDEVQRG